jgi:hypothetical protein
MNEIVKKDHPTNLDNFAGWEEGTEGDDRPENSDIIQGVLIRFSNEAKWLNRDSDELPADLELVAADLVRLVQKWKDEKPVETRILEPGEKFPDIEAMNEKIPRKEWEEGPAGPRGPYQAQHVLYLVDLKTMDKYTYPTSTSGGRIAIRDLRDRIMWMRRFKGPEVFAVVTFSKAWMNTKYGGRFRPSFTIKRWVRLGGSGKPVEALPPTAPATPATPAAQQTASQSDLPIVQEPTLAEEVNDEVPDFNSPQQSAPQSQKPAPNLKTTARRERKKNPKKSGTKPAGKKLTTLDAG